MKKFNIFLTLLCILSITAGCGQTTTNAADLTNVQPDEIDDLSATLEEAVLSLTGDVSDTLSRVDTLGIPNGSVEEQQDMFLDLRSEISDVDRRIDDLDDTVERSYRENHISREEFQKLSRELESLEELMDSAEEKLEFVYGMED